MRQGVKVGNKAYYLKILQIPESVMCMHKTSNKEIFCIQERIFSEVKFKNNGFKVLSENLQSILKISQNNNLFR